MSAKTRWNTGSTLPSAAGMCSPHCAISASRPTVFSATVLPPVLGPLITSTGLPKPTVMLTGTGSRVVAARQPQPLGQGGQQQRMARIAQVQVQAALVRDDRGRRRSCRAP